MIYTVGYQPIEIVGRKHPVTDIMNLLANEGVPGGNMRQAVIEFLKKHQLAEGDKYLFNTVRNRDIIPYVWENLNASNGLSNLFVYDPPYAASDIEIYKILRELNHHLGGDRGSRTWIDAVNAMREMITNTKENLPQSEYFNAATLISDANMGDSESLIKHLSKFANPYEIKMERKAAFVGDPVNPKFFDYLNAKGTYVVSFMPYDLFLMPCTAVESYYYSNPLFQSQLYMLVELRQMISQPERCPDVIYFNPGGIYLTQADAEFYAYKLGPDVKCEILAGNYNGQPV